jgi:hypothetical protein
LKCQICEADYDEQEWGKTRRFTKFLTDWFKSHFPKLAEHPDFDPVGTAQKTLLPKTKLCEECAVDYILMKYGN